MRPPLLPLLLILTASIMGCAPDERPADEPAPDEAADEAARPTPQAPQAVKTDTLPDPAPPEPVQGVAPDLAEALSEMHRRPRCNRVMGCPPSVTVMQAGPAAVPAILADLETHRAQADFGVMQQIELLGQLQDPRALPMLHGLLEDKRWEIRSRTSLAVARLGKTESAPVIRRHLTSALQRRDTPMLAALLFAAERCGVTMDPPPRTRLAQVLAVPKSEAAKLNGGMYAFLLRVARESRLMEAIPVARLGATHLNNFVRKEALWTLGALQDHGGVPYCVGRLDDEVPSVRRAALACLRQITGDKQRATADAWKAWCEANQCREGFPPKTPQAKGKP